MALDGIALNALENELNTALCGGRLQKVYQPEKDELVFHITNFLSPHQVRIRDCT